MRNKKYHHFMFYSVESKELYAFTTDKDVAKRFRKERRKGLFYMIEKYFNYEQSESLFYEKSECVLNEYESSKIKDLKIVITKLERVIVENSMHNLMFVSLPLAASITPTVFKGEVREHLANLNYHKIYACTHLNNRFQVTDYVSFDFVLLFVYIFGDTLNWEGDG